MFILVTGGCRSGKSDFALSLARGREGPRVFLATAEPLDDGMKARIERHKARRGADWSLVEEPLRVPEAVRGAFESGKTVLLDCVTLWISNLLCGKAISGEGEAAAAAERLCASARAGPGDLIAVTNEVGWGVVPQTAIGRLFRDCAGRTNQVLAAAADEVWLLVSGIPLRIKPQGTRDA